MKLRRNELCHECHPLIGPGIVSGAYIEKIESWGKMFQVPDHFTEGNHKHRIIDHTCRPQRWNARYVFRCGKYVNC